MPDLEQACEQCGQAMRVQILTGYRAGNPVVRYLCLQCADAAAESPHAITAGRPRLSVAATLVLGGACLALAGLVAERAGVGHVAGFGLGQQLATSLGVLSVVLGALLRVDALAVLGTVICACAVTADLLWVAPHAQVALLRYAVGLGGVVLMAVGISLRVPWMRTGAACRL